MAGQFLSSAATVIERTFDTHDRYTIYRAKHGIMQVGTCLHTVTNFVTSPRRACRKHAEQKRETMAILKIRINHECSWTTSTILAEVQSASGKSPKCNCRSLMRDGSRWTKKRSALCFSGETIRDLRASLLLCRPGWHASPPPDLAYVGAGETTNVICSASPEDVRKSANRSCDPDGSTAALTRYPTFGDSSTWSCSEQQADND